MERIRKVKKKAKAPKVKVPLTVDCSSSSNLVSAKYDPGTKAMVVDFKSGAGYVYGGVPELVWKGFVEAESRGSYLAKEIKPNYTACKLEEQ